MAHAFRQVTKPEFAFGPVLTDPNHVEAVIRRAQLAILNPAVNYQKFVMYQLPEEPEKHPLGSPKQASFSRNVIVLEISGPDVTDLTLVDLPGIIQNVAQGEDVSNISWWRIW